MNYPLSFIKIKKILFIVPLKNKIEENAKFKVSSLSWNVVARERQTSKYWNRGLFIGMQFVSNSSWALLALFRTSRCNITLL